MTVSSSNLLHKRSRDSALVNSHSALGAYYRRMRARLGAPKAITATAHKLARLVYPPIRTTLHVMESLWRSDTLSAAQEETMRHSSRPDLPPTPPPYRTLV